MAKDQNPSDCLKCSATDCGEHVPTWEENAEYWQARALAAGVTDDMCHRFQATHKRIWPGAGWPALAEVRHLLVEALGAQVQA